MSNNRWNIDVSHSAIQFSVRHMMLSKVHGRFGSWSGRFELDEQAPDRSVVEVTIDAASIDTREPKRDEHLRSADFFAVADHPTLRFRSTAVRRADDGYLVDGDLTIRGVTRPVTLTVEDTGRAKDPWGGERAGFAARATLSRKDFGLTWNALLETGGVVVGDKIEIAIDVQAVREAAAEKAA